MTCTVVYMMWESESVFQEEEAIAGPSPGRLEHPVGTYVTWAPAHDRHVDAAGLHEAIYSIEKRSTPTFLGISTLCLSFPMPELMPNCQNLVRRGKL